MKAAFLVIALALFALAHATESNVVVLTNDNFDTIIAENEHVFVEFYAPWCGHCKKLAPEYEVVANKLKEAGSKVVVAKLDATEHSGPASNNGVRGYPTLIFFKNGTPIKYEGDRSVDALVNFINKKSGPPSILYSTSEELEAAKKSGVVIAYVDSEDSTEYKNWVRAATSGQLEDFRLGHVTDKSLSGSYSNTVVIYKAGDDTPLVYPEDKITKTKVVSWITTEGYPLYEEISQNVWQRAQTAGKALLVTFVDRNNADEVKLVADLAAAFKGRISVSFAGIDTQKALAERWGASGNKFPTGILATFPEGNPSLTIFDEDNESAFNLETGSKFVESALKGEYEGYLKSEPIPEDNSAPLKTLVGKNFKDIVNNAEQDVFVEFYAPWCGHCKKLAPVWEELANTFAEVEHVTIAKIDATANNLPKEIDVRGYPTLIFFPRDNKKGISYEGDRELDALKQFVVEKSTKPVKLPNKEDL